jgi:hypothetical protein
MAVVNFTPLLGLALPTTGDLNGTWGTTVNNSITTLLDSAVAGTTTLSADVDVTLSTTNGSTNQARNAVILWTATGTTTRYITAPAQSKAYIVINQTGGSQSIVIRGSGPTTGVTVTAGNKALVAWNGSDFVKITGGPINLASSDVTGVLPIANGGTNSTATPTAGGAGYGTGTAHAYTAAGTSGQVLTSNGSGAPTWQNPTGAIGPLVYNTTTVNTNLTVPTGQNAFTVGPVTVSTGYTVTVSSGQRWVVI